MPDTEAEAYMQRFNPPIQLAPFFLSQLEPRIQDLFSNKSDTINAQHNLQAFRVSPGFLSNRETPPPHCPDQACASEDPTRVFISTPEQFVFDKLTRMLCFAAAADETRMKA